MDKIHIALSVTTAIVFFVSLYGVLVEIRVLKKKVALSEERVGKLVDVVDGILDLMQKQNN